MVEIETESQSHKEKYAGQAKSKGKREGPCGTSRGWCAHKGVSGRDESGGPRSRHERLTADGAARSHYLADQPQSIHQFTFAALLLTCAIRTTLGAYRQVSPGSAWTRLRSHGRVGGALHLQRRRRRDSGSCTNKQHQRRKTGPMEAQFGGDKYVPDTEEVYWQRDPAESVEGERRQRHAESGGDAEGAVASTV